MFNPAENMDGYVGQNVIWTYGEQVKMNSRHAAALPIVRVLCEGRHSSNVGCGKVKVRSEWMESPIRKTSLG